MRHHGWLSVLTADCLPAGWRREMTSNNKTCFLNFLLFSSCFHLAFFLFFFSWLRISADSKRNCCQESDDCTLPLHVMSPVVAPCGHLFRCRFRPSVNCRQSCNILPLLGDWDSTFSQPFWFCYGDVAPTVDDDENLIGLANGFRIALELDESNELLVIFTFVCSVRFF